MYQKDTLPFHLRNKANLKTIGFQRIENYDTDVRIYNDKLMPVVRNDVIDMDDPDIAQEIKDNIEFTIDMSNPKKHKLNVTVKRNETRAREQQMRRERILAMDELQGKTDRIDKNVFILYIDNLSRANFKRRLPKVAEWLGQFVDNDTSSLELFQFFRYHTVYFSTRKNNNALWYGQIDRVHDKSSNVFDEFNENGYVTGFAKDG